MGVRQPALLFRAAINLDQDSKLREEQLSTGCYVLADVTCRACLSPMGWSYLHASNEVNFISHMAICSATCLLLASNLKSGKSGKDIVPGCSFRSLSCIHPDQRTWLCMLGPKS